MDNVIVNQPTTTGATIATEDVAGVQHQKILVEFSDGAGGATMVSAADPLPVDGSATTQPISATALPLPLGASTEATLASILAKIIVAPSTEAKQDALNALITTLNSIVATAAKQDTGNTSVASIDTKTPTVGQKAMAASSPIVIASDQSSIPVAATLTAETTKVIGTINIAAAQTLATVTTVGAVTAITNALPAGTNAIGKLAANSGVDIGDVDITSIAAGTNLIGKFSIDQVTANANEVVTKTGSTTVISAITAAAATNKVDVGLVNGEAVDVGAGTEAAAIRVTLPTDGTGKIATVSTVTAVTAITNALPAGTNLMGEVGIDQTTPGTTNAVAVIAGQNGVAGGDGNVDATTQRIVMAANVISSSNSSTTPLSANAIFTGTSEDIISYSEARVTIYSDVPSATEGLSIQQSTDNTNWIISDTYSIAAATGKTFAVPRQARYFRIVYTNGGAAQSTFILQVTYKRIGGSLSSQKASDNYSNETDLEQEQSFLMNYNPNTGTWYRVRGDSTDGLYVNPRGFNVDYSTRMQEKQVLYAYSALIKGISYTERYNSNRDFIEIR
jgi:hypothetical protein